MGEPGSDRVGHGIDLVDGETGQVTGGGELGAEKGRLGGAAEQVDPVQTSPDLGLGHPILQLEG